MPLSPQQIRYLRGLTHNLQVVVTVADKGLTENVMSELEAAFTKHELIKVKLRGDKPTRKDWIEQIRVRCKAERVHVIGHVACFFRRNTKKPVIALQNKS